MNQESAEQPGPGKSLVKFSHLPVGTLFQFSYAGLPPQLATAGQRPFRKVAQDGAIDIADPRKAKIYVAPDTNVIPAPPGQGK